MFYVDDHLAIYVFVDDNQVTDGTNPYQPERSRAAMALAQDHVVGAESALCGCPAGFRFAFKG